MAGINTFESMRPLLPFLLLLFFTSYLASTFVDNNNSQLSSLIEDSKPLEDESKEGENTDKEFEQFLSQLVLGSGQNAEKVSHHPTHPFTLKSFLFFEVLIPPPEIT